MHFNLQTLWRDRISFSHDAHSLDRRQRVGVGLDLGPYFFAAGLGAGSISARVRSNGSTCRAGKMKVHLE